MDMTAYTMTCARAHTLTHTHTHTRTHTHNATRPSIACQAHTYKQPSVLQYDTHTQHTHTHTHTTHRNGSAPDVSLLQRTCVRQGGRPLPQQHLLHHQHLQHLQQQQAVTSNSKQGSVGPPLAAQQHAMLQAKQLQLHTQQQQQQQRRVQVIVVGAAFLGRKCSCFILIKWCVDFP